MTAPIVRFAVAYGAGLAAGLVFLPPLGASLILAGLAIACAGLERRDAARITISALVLAAAVGVAAGRLAADRQAHECAHAWRPGTHAAWVVTTEPVSSGGRVSVTVTQAAERCGGELDARFPDSTAQALPAAGATVVLVGTMDDLRHFRVRRWRVLAGRAPVLPRIRAALSRRIAALYGPRAPLVEALVLGRRDDLDPRLKQTFAASGLAHLLAIAGLHVGFIVGWAILVAGWFVPRRKAVIVGAIFAWGYVCLLGFSAPATRAATFIALRTLARVRQRHPAPSAVLAVAALVVVTIDPAAITSAGLWLSVAAVGGMGWLLESGRLMERLARSGNRLGVALHDSRALRAVAQLGAASFAATFFTAPVAAFVFGAVAPIGVVANIVAVPLMGLALPAVLASLVIGAFAPGAGLALAALERIAVAAAQIPAGHVSGTPGWKFALPWALLVGLVVWLRRDRPTLLVARRRLIVASAALVWGALVLLMPLPDRAGGLAIYILDVGQGDAIAIRTPHGHWLLVDAGPRTPERDAGRDIVVPFLRHHGAQHLDFAMPTHTDADHLGGMPYVLRTEHPDLMFDNGQPVGTTLFLDYERALADVHPDWHAARTGDSLAIDSVSLAVLSPSAAWMASHLETNANSVVLRLTYGGFSALLTGDMDSVTEADILASARPVDFLKVAHHGSSTSSSGVWLDRIHPKAAVISVGANNHYHHPSPETLVKLSVRGIPFWRTDEGGTVTVTSDGRYFVVSQGHSHTWLEGIGCLIRRARPSSASLPSSSACTPAPPPVSFPVSSPTSPAPPGP